MQRRRVQHPVLLARHRRLAGASAPLPRHRVLDNPLEHGYTRAVHGHERLDALVLRLHSAPHRVHVPAARPFRERRPDDGEASPEEHSLTFDRASISVAELEAGEAITATASGFPPGTPDSGFRVRISQIDGDMNPIGEDVFLDVPFDENGSFTLPIDAELLDGAGDGLPGTWRVAIVTGGDTAEDGAVGEVAWYGDFTITAGEDTGDGSDDGSLALSPGSLSLGEIAANSEADGTTGFLAAISGLAPSTTYDFLVLHSEDPMAGGTQWTFDADENGAASFAIPELSRPDDASILGEWTAAVNGSAPDDRDWIVDTTFTVTEEAAAGGARRSS